MLLSLRVASTDTLCFKIAGTIVEQGQWGGEELCSFEAAMLGNLQPSNAEEVFACFLLHLALPRLPLLNIKSLLLPCPLPLTRFGSLAVARVHEPIMAVGKRRDPDTRLSVVCVCQAKSLIKSLSRFSDNDVEEMCQIVARKKASNPLLD